MKTLFLLLTCLVFGTRAFASEEEYAIWSSVEIRTADIPHAGPVVLNTRTADGRIADLVIVAFGRTNALPQDALKQIVDYPIADLRLTHGPGYEQLGGYSLHVRLHRVGYDLHKRLKDETAIITLTEKAGFRPVRIESK
jgi:hypothetical protein